MSKHESPPFRMKIEGGRLVPSSAWDAERLDTYRNGSMLSVQITQQKNRKLERKYWAILGKVIDHCPVQQRTTEDLHRAIKLKLGVVDAFFTIDGKLRVDVKSTTTMEEPEYRLFFEDAMALLHKVTGVDPLTLGAEAADVGEDDDPELPATVAGEAAADNSPPPTAAAEPAGADSTEAPAEPSAPSVPDDKAWLLSVAKQLWAATGKGEQELVGNIAADLKKRVPEGTPKLTRDRAQSIVKKCKEVCFGEIEAGEALEIIAGIVGVEPREIVAKTQEAA